jgi:integrase
MSAVTVGPVAESLTVGEVGERYVHQIEHVLQRKPSTVADYGYILRRHLDPFFGPKGIDLITPDDLAAYMAAKTQGGLSIKTVSNHLNFAHGLFSFAVKRGWARDNPVAVLDRPRVGGPNPDIRYLDPEELEALLRAVPDDDLGETERILYLTATMTGLRQGELVAPALARCRLDRGRNPRPSQLHPRAMGDAEISPVVARRPNGRPGGWRARPQGLGLAGRRRPRLRAPRARNRPRRFQAPKAVRSRPRAIGCAPGQGPRPSPHLRDTTSPRAPSTLLIPTRIRSRVRSDRAIEAGTKSDGSCYAETEP